jgi:hypothetical protein
MTAHPAAKSMSEQSQDQASLSLEVLLNIAKQAIASECDIKPEDVRVDEDGDIGYDICGSAVVFVGPSIDPPAFNFKSQLLANVEDKPQVYTLINEINIDIPLGQLFYSEGDIYFFYRLLVDNPTPALVSAVLGVAIEATDHYDDRLKNLLGGERYIETTDDEVEV